MSRFDRDSRDTERYYKQLRSPNLSAADRLARHPNAYHHVYPPSYATQPSRYSDGYRYVYTTSDTPQVPSHSRSRYLQTSEDLEAPRSDGRHDSYRDLEGDNAHRTLAQPYATRLSPDIYEWTCSRFILHNPDTYDFCSICGSPRIFGSDFSSHLDQNDYNAHHKSSTMTYDDPYPAPRESSALDSRPRPSSFVVQSDGPDRPHSPDLRHESARRSGGDAGQDSRAEDSRDGLYGRGHDSRRYSRRSGVRDV